MRQLIANELTLTCDVVDFTTSTNIEVWLRQDKLFFQYTPTVVSAHIMTIAIPFEDAKKLEPGSAEIQWALIDANGKPVSPDPERVTVGRIIKDGGYNPV